MALSERIEEAEDQLSEKPPSILLHVEDGEANTVSEAVGDLGFESRAMTPYLVRVREVGSDFPEDEVTSWSTVERIEVEFPGSVMSSGNL